MTTPDSPCFPSLATVPVVMVGEYGSREDVEAAGNAFVLNVIAGMVLDVLFAAVVTAG